MTTLRVQVTEDLYDRLLQAAEPLGIQPEVLLARRVEAHKDLPVGKSLVAVHGQTLDALEQILSGGAVLDQRDLLQKVERLAGISMLHVRFRFSPGQLEELARRAERQGKSVEQLIDLMAPRVYEQFFNLIDNR